MLLNMVFKWMGHSQMETTAIYANAVGEEQQSISTDAKTNLYLSHERLRIGAGCSGRSARKYKDDCAQALSDADVDVKTSGIRGKLLREH
jgi:hypothetical protein